MIGNVIRVERKRAIDDSRTQRQWNVTRGHVHSGGRKAYQNLELAHRLAGKRNRSIAAQLSSFLVTKMILLKCMRGFDRRVSCSYSYTYSYIEYEYSY